MFTHVESLIGTSSTGRQSVQGSSVENLGNFDVDRLLIRRVKSTGFACTIAIQFSEKIERLKMLDSRTRNKSKSIGDIA